MLPQGWKTLGDAATEAEEQAHIELWQAFAAALGTQAASRATGKTAKLTQLAERLFAQPQTAIGALYAFELQQPETAASKLDGLQKFYGFEGQGLRYFEAHAQNQHEAARLAKMFAQLSEEDKTSALAACWQLGAALWDALTDIYQSACGEAVM